MNNIFQISLAITGMINCLLVACFLFFVKQGNLKSNKFLALLSLSVCLKLCYALLINYKHEWGVMSIILSYLSESAYISIGPILLLYFYALFKKSFSKIVAFLLFIPAFSPFFGHIFKYDIPLSLMQVYFFLFLVFIFFKLKTIYSNFQNNNLLINDKRWINTLYGSFLFIWLSVNLLFIDFRFYFFELSVIFTAVFYLNFYIGVKYYWLRIGDMVTPQKYKNSTLTIEEENDILFKVQKLMENEKLYIENEISLPKVAKIIDTKPYKLSQVINGKTGMTFNEFINSYRIKDIEIILKSPESRNTKISSIAFDFGFNSISSFNTAFKRFTNNTPSQFRDEKMMSN